MKVILLAALFGSVSVRFGNTGIHRLNGGSATTPQCQGLALSDRRIELRKTRLPLIWEMRIGGCRRTGRVQPRHLR